MWTLIPTWHQVITGAATTLLALAVAFIVALIVRKM